MKSKRLIKGKTTILWLFFIVSLALHVNAVAAKKGEVIKDSYIVVLERDAFSSPMKKGVTESVKQIADRMIASARQDQRLKDNAKGVYRSLEDENKLNKVGFVYEHALKGFSATLTPQAVEALSKNPMVAYIDRDHVVYPASLQIPTPSWGLDRIDQRDLPLDNTYEYHEDGTNVHVYVIDSGIRADHVEFTGRIGNGYDYIDYDTTPEDCTGHGSHVAGIIAGQSVGVAKNATIHPVRVIDCFNRGSVTTLIKGIDWVTANYQLPAVVNMSVYAASLPSIDEAVNNSIAQGITYVAAAGNDYGYDACEYSPARISRVITVAASDPTDQRLNTSNIGTCVDLFAPGENIYSAGIDSSSELVYDDHTSVAAPHVAGVAARYLEVNPDATPRRVADTIVFNSTRQKITDPGEGTPNRLLHSQVKDYKDAYSWMVPVIHMLLL